MIIVEIINAKSVAYLLNIREAIVLSHSRMHKMF